MKRVLNRLGYCNEHGIIDIKGKIACFLGTGNELVLTELLFDGVFVDMTVAQCVAILSCFVVDKFFVEDEPKLAQELSAPFKIIQV